MIPWPLLLSMLFSTNTRGDEPMRVHAIGADERTRQRACQPTGTRDAEMRRCAAYTWGERDAGPANAAWDGKV